MSIHGGFPLAVRRALRLRHSVVSALQSLDEKTLSEPRLPQPHRTGLEVDGSWDPSPGQLGR